MTLADLECWQKPGGKEGLENAPGDLLSALRVAVLGIQYPGQVYNSLIPAGHIAGIILQDPPPCIGVDLAGAAAGGLTAF